MNNRTYITWRLFNAAIITVLLLAALLGRSAHTVNAKADAVFVKADAGWVKTSIFIEAYRDVFLEAYGITITGNLGQLPEAKSGPAGQIWNLGCGEYESAPPPCALIGAPYGSLLGRIGEDGEPFLIGDSGYFNQAVTGYLYLAINDNLEFYGDNSGGFSVLLRSGNMAGGYIIAYPVKDVIEGRNWTNGAEVRLRIFNPQGGLVYSDAQVAYGDGVNVFFDLAAQGFDLVAGQRLLMSSGRVVRELWVSPVAVTGYSIQDATITGICDPSIFCWAHLDTRDFDEMSIEGGSWTARFEYLIPWEEGWAFQWDKDGDETRIRFNIDTPDARMISAFPEDDVVEGVYWKVGQPIVMKVFDNDLVEVHEQIVIPEEDESRAGGSYYRVSLGDQGINIQPGFTITATDGAIYRELLVTNIAVSGFNLPEGAVMGICDPAIFFYTHMMDGREAEEITVAEDGVWTARFTELISEEWLTAFQWEADGDETRIFYQVP